MTIVLENIRSAWNVGSVFRSCDAIGCDLILVGYTAQPTEANMKLIHKTGLGAEKTVSWQYYEHSQQVFDALPDRTHLAIEISDNSTDIYDFIKTNQNLKTDDLVLWFGNEIHGVSELVRSQAYQEVHLPMKGMKESLNVSSCMCSVAYLLDFGLTESEL
jgi:23S rRNA (guanosine2251-2'-O)-methyltransferase